LSKEYEKEPAASMVAFASCSRVQPQLPATLRLGPSLHLGFTDVSVLKLSFGNVPFSRHRCMLPDFSGDTLTSFSKWLLSFPSGMRWHSVWCVSHRCTCRSAGSSDQPSFAQSCRAAYSLEETAAFGSSWSKILLVVDHCPYLCGTTLSASSRPVLCGPSFGTRSRLNVLFVERKQSLFRRRRCSCRATLTSTLCSLGRASHCCTIPKQEN
jgi:hypothetical protein